MAMPVMDGQAAIREIVRLNPRQKFVATSSLRVGNEVAVSSNIRRVLAKPFTAAKLLHAVRAAIDAPSQ